MLFQWHLYSFRLNDSAIWIGIRLWVQPVSKLKKTVCVWPFICEHLFPSSFGKSIFLIDPFNKFTDISPLLVWVFISLMETLLAVDGGLRAGDLSVPWEGDFWQFLHFLVQLRFTCPCSLQTEHWSVVELCLELSVVFLALSVGLFFNYIRTFAS